MASPQKENGFTGTANELIEAICCLEMSGACHRILRFIERKTYGYNKKEDSISFTQFQKGTGLYRNAVNRSLTTLLQMGVIVKDKGGYINKYRINKDYERWTSPKNGTSPKSDTKTSPKSDTKTSPINGTHKRKKENKYISKQSLPLKKKDMSWKKPYNENAHSDDLPEVDADTGEVIKKEVIKSSCYAVYAIFEKVLGKYPLNWKVNKTQRLSAENLHKEKGLKAVENALNFYKENKDVEYCPQVSTPYDLDSKWTKLAQFRRKLNQ